MNDIFDAMYAASRAQIDVPLSVRRDRLNRLEAVLVENETAFVQAISEDYGTRVPGETRMAELMPLRLALRHTRRHLRRWMRPKRRAVEWVFWPATAKVVPQPLGVVGIMSPWNYPLFLSIGPLIDALGAGNRVMLKPSELTPKTSAVLASAIAEKFADDEVHVVLGEVKAAKAFSKLPFDHLIFTGSTEVGKLIAAAAAPNLTPLTLELGGKSPAIVLDDAALSRTARSIVTGRLLNSGQTCVAVDYVYAPRSILRELIAAIEAQLKLYYPDLGRGYSSILADKYYERHQKMLASVLEETEVIQHGVDDLEARKLAPRLVIDPPKDSPLLNEEIFGPILPIVPYDDLEDVLAAVNAGPRPLALYCYGTSRRGVRRVVRETLSGTMAVNASVLQLGQNNLPFGGVGASGYGAYHGKDGFTRFSHTKGVFQPYITSSLELFGAPWTRLSEWAFRFVWR